MKALYGIFKIEKVPTSIRNEMVKRAVGDYNGQLQPEDINFINDLLYLAWFYAHGFLIYSKQALTGEIESIDTNGKKIIEKLDGKFLVETRTILDMFSNYFNEESTIYPDGIGSDFSDIYSNYGLIDFKEEMQKIVPEKVFPEDIIKTIDKKPLKQLIDHFNSLSDYNCTSLSINETIIICLAWMFYHGFLFNDEQDRLHINDELASINLDEFIPNRTFEKDLADGISSPFRTYYDFDKIVEIASWDKREYYLRRHLQP